MDSRYAIFDTVGIGAICSLSFAIVVFAINPACFGQKIDALSNFILLNESNLFAKWAAIGVASTVLGAIIQVISICLFSRWHYDDEYNVSSPVGQNLTQKGVGRTRGF